MASGVSFLNCGTVKLTSRGNLVLIFLIGFIIDISFGQNPTMPTLPTFPPGFLVPGMLPKQKLRFGAGYGLAYVLSMSSTTEYTYSYEKNKEIYPARVYLEAENASRNDPIVLLVYQNKYVYSWSLPHIVDENDPSKDYKYLAHTLYAIGINEYAKDPKPNWDPLEVCNPTVQISTKSDVIVLGKLRTSVVKDFILKPGQNQTIVISYNEPVYYYYNFKDSKDSDVHVASVMITSNSTSCMLLSFQDTTGEIWDMEDTITRDNHWQAMTEKGGMVLTVSNSEDIHKIIPIFLDIFEAKLLMLGRFVERQEYPNGFFVVMALAKSDEECTLEPSDYKLKRMKTVMITVKPNVSNIIQLSIIFGTVGFFLLMFLVIVILYIGYLRSSIKAKRARNERIPVIEGHEKSCLKYCLIPYHHTQNTSNNYIWLSLIVFVIYLVPAAQDVLGYKSVLSSSENICYYNFFCMWSLPIFNIGHINNFNHVLSNIGYITLGTCFMVLTYLKTILDVITRKEGYGIQKPYGYFYAMGASMIMEGIMSIAYNMCPRKSNCYLDTCFFNIMGILIILNLYEIRIYNEDQIQKNRRQYWVFLALSGLTVMCVLETYITIQTLIWIIFTFIHILISFGLTWRIDEIILVRMFYMHGVKNMNRIDTIHFGFFIVGNAFNILTAIIALGMRYTFANHIMFLIWANVSFYLCFYITMKKLHKEHMCRKTYTLITFSILFWIPALGCYLATETTWEKSASDARNLNQECLLVYYDLHDCWHFFSSISLLSTFCLLLRMDDGLNSVPTSDIINFHALTSNAKSKSSKGKK